MILKIKRLSEDAIVPTRGTEYAAGWDLYSANIDRVDIHPGCGYMFPTGWAMEIPDGYFGGIYARSGLASKQGLRPSNCTGIVDSDYRGEVKVSLHNDSNEIQSIYPGTRIAQLIIQPYQKIDDFEFENTLSDTKRGEGGFGSTGQ